MNENNQTTHVCIAVLHETSMMSLSSIVDPLRAANRLSRKPLFSWSLASLDGERVALSCGISIDVDRKLDGSESGDLFILVAGFNQEQHAPKSCLQRLRSITKNFKTVCAVEAGTWVFARAGIIREHRVTTHWEDLENLAFAYPKLNVVGERFVIDGKVWTSGGASPSLDLLLHYLRITQHESLAMDVADVFIYNESKSATDVQAYASLNRLKRIEPRLASAVELMESNIETPLGISSIARSISCSQRTLEVLSNTHLGLSPSAYYLRLRLQTARKLVLDSSNPMSDVAVRTGFNSQSAFSRAFLRRYYISPLSLRKQSVR